MASRHKCDVPLFRYQAILQREPPGHQNENSANYISVSKGSLSELETHMLIAADLGYLPLDQIVFECLGRVAKLIAGLHKYVAK